MPRPEGGTSGAYADHSCEGVEGTADPHTHAEKSTDERRFERSSRNIRRAGIAMRLLQVLNGAQKGCATACSWAGCMLHGDGLGPAPTVCALKKASACRLVATGAKNLS